jgi:hypothetical protein
MFQRIQTIWLSLTTILSGILCVDKIISFKDNTNVIYSIEFTGIYKNITGGHDLLDRTFIISALLIIIMFFSIISLLNFKRRYIQIKTVTIVIISSICLLGALCYHSLCLIHNYLVTPDPDLTIFIPILILIFSILAYRSISKDEKIVRSYERLR